MEDKVIGKYRVLRSIGAGGMATVFLASHRDVPNLKTVLKKLSDPLLVERFKREADKLAVLDGHAGICQIKHFFDFEGDFYIVMEYIDGPTLDDLVKSDNPPDQAAAVRMTRAILNTLEHAHQQGIVHRDIKPTNIMLDRLKQVKIIDFGVAKGAADPSLTQVGTSVGSPRYMAPEQFNAQAEVDWVRCDLYAVGVTLYYLLARRLPFEGSDIYQICDYKRQVDVPPPSSFDPSIPPELDAIVLKAVARNPLDRYATAAEMRSALEHVDLAPRTLEQNGTDRTMVLGGGGPPPPARTPTPARPAPAAAAPTATAPTPTPTGAGSAGWTSQAATPSAAMASSVRKWLPWAGGIALVAVIGTVALITLRGGDGAERVPPPARQQTVRLPAPTLVAPAEDAVLKDGRVTFNWSADADPGEAFTLQYGAEAGFADAGAGILCRGGEHRLAEPLRDGVFFWRVRRGAPGDTTGQWSGAGSFTVAIPRSLANTGRPSTTPPAAKPAPKPTGSVRVGVKVDGTVQVRGTVALDIDGRKQSLEIPGTVPLPPGDYTIKAVFVYSGGQELETTATVVVEADEISLLWLLFKTTP